MTLRAREDQPPELPVLFDALSDHLRRSGSCVWVLARRERLNVPIVSITNTCSIRGSSWPVQYARWIAVETDSIRLRRVLEPPEPPGLDRHRQWMAEEFEPIDHVMSGFVRVHLWA